MGRGVMRRAVLETTLGRRIVWVVGFFCLPNIGTALTGAAMGWTGGERMRSWAETRSEANAGGRREESKVINKEMRELDLGKQCRQRI
ncbi:hypothetical protein LX36DRAFT_290111 [Colletotrichum falcatum]|nr:hypothetical protein LX36DRAFT_290111 [Colletotrichum falcatum]